MPSPEREDVEISTLSENEQDQRGVVAACQTLCYITDHSRSITASHIKSRERDPFDPRFRHRLYWRTPNAFHKIGNNENYVNALLQRSANSRLGVIFITKYMIRRSLLSQRDHVYFSSEKQVYSGLADTSAAL